MTVDKVRFVGDPVAIVVAETAKQAKDAAEAVFVDIDALPAVTDAAAAAAPGAPQIYDGVSGNVASWTFISATLRRSTPPSLPPRMSRN